MERQEYLIRTQLHEEDEEDDEELDTDMMKKGTKWLKYF